MTVKTTHILYPELMLLYEMDDGGFYLKLHYGLAPLSEKLAREQIKDSTNQYYNDTTQPTN